MAKDIYDQHRAAFPQVSAYVVARNGEKVATVAIKYPRDGAGRLYAYVHWLGVEMVRGHAGGYGYDKTGAAVRDAADKIKPRDDSAYIAEMQAGGHWKAAQEAALHEKAENELIALFTGALTQGGGSDWQVQLRKAGFEVWQAV